MQQFTVALLQMTAAGTDQAANLAKGELFCRRAAALGADLALFPEMWNVGYTFPRDVPPAADAGPEVSWALDLWRARALAGGRRRAPGAGAGGAGAVGSAGDHAR